MFLSFNILVPHTYNTIPKFLVGWKENKRINYSRANQNTQRNAIHGAQRTYARLHMERGVRSTHRALHAHGWSAEHVRSTEHGAWSTEYGALEHVAWSTEHGARSTEHGRTYGCTEHGAWSTYGARSTEHARSTEQPQAHEPRSPEPRASSTLAWSTYRSTLARSPGALIREPRSHGASGRMSLTSFKPHMGYS